MKILCLISFANHGGAQIALVKLARHLRARGHEVELIFLYGDDALFQHEPGARVLLPATGLGPLQYGKLFGRLFRTVRNSQPDAILSFLPLANVLGAITARISGVKRVIISHRSPVSTYGRVMRVLDRMVGSLGCYDKIVCVSKAVSNELESYPNIYRKRISVIHNGVEAMGEVGRDGARQEFGLPEQGFVFAALGRLHYQKNYKNLLKWFAQTSDGTLLVAGDGPDRSDLEALIRTFGLGERVRLLGNLPKAGARALLAAADVFVQPSRYEGQSNAVLEAMLAGLPMILSDIPEQRETVESADEEDVALLVPLNDDMGWVRAMETLRMDDDLRIRLGVRAAHHARTHFAVDLMVDKFEAACVG
jgi:glycosyltransferase involved in cell wall biosynthesis